MGNRVIWTQKVLLFFWGQHRFLGLCIEPGCPSQLARGPGSFAWAGVTKLVVSWRRVIFSFCPGFVLYKLAVCTGLNLKAAFILELCSEVRSSGDRCCCLPTISSRA